ncbi:MAG: alpha/beta hydrolase [Elainellaceae cyanobacterium]
MIHAVQRGLIPRFIRRVLLGSGLMLGLGIGTAAIANSAIAAEQVVFTYGGLARSIDVDDLRTFAETGEQTPNLRFLLGITNQDADDVQTILSEDLPISLRAIDRITYSLPGEYALFQLGRRFSTRSGDANIQALRAGLILSASDDNQVSLIEFLENYPTRSLYVDSRQLLGDVRELGDVLEVVNDRVVPYVVAAQEFLEGLICECDNPTPASTEVSEETSSEPSDSEMTMPDSEMPDSEMPDSEMPDSEMPDSEMPDSEMPDSEMPDSEMPDSEMPDSEMPDSEMPDSEMPDSEMPDSEMPDSEMPDAEMMMPEESSEVEATEEMEVAEEAEMTEATEELEESLEVEATEETEASETP